MHNTTYWARPKIVRLLPVLLAIVFYIALTSLDANYTFAHNKPQITMIVWVFFSFSILTALMFLVVGSLVWLYSRNRLVASLLFGFSLVMMIIFATETGSAKEIMLSMIAALSTNLAIPLLNALLLSFPKDFLALPSGTTNNQLPRSLKSIQPALLIRMYIITLFLINVLAICYSLPLYFPTPHLPTWLKMFNSFEYAIGSITVIVTIVASYRYAPSQRERQQLRLFVGGTLLIVTPFIFLTVLPQSISIFRAFAVNPQLTTIPLVLFPVILGYSILRYQILVVDVHIRRLITWVAGVIGLSLLTFLAVAISSIIFDAKTSFYVISVAGIAVALGPLVWSYSKRLSERIFFSEILYYQRLLDQPNTLNDVTLDLAEISQLMTLSASQTFGATENALFVLDEDSGHFRICPNLRYDGTDDARISLVRRILAPLDAAAAIEHNIVVELAHTLTQHIGSSRRPLLWQELLPDGARRPHGFARYLNMTAPQHTIDAMFVPVRAQGNMIGILVIGERPDHEPYGGPDFEIVQLILTRFSSILESARLYAHASRHATLLNNLYRASAISGNAFQSLQQVATAYTQVAMDVVAARAEVWLHDKALNALWYVSTEGQPSSHISHEDCLPLTHARDWSAWFYEGNARTDNSAQIPTCLRETPPFPFAWLPLYKDKEHLGVLVLIYPPPHAFLREEMHVLQMFASQCAAAIDNTRITIELRSAYERQKELDQLKDQFIITASHELRTPLTAVQGYLELLKEYDGNLPNETRSEFVIRAGRSCDELTLMVENIMDASRLQIDAENIRPALVPLTQSVMHILEILETMMRRENRVVKLTILPDTFVLADEKRLRQVMLNLMSNALKYSPPASPIEISARTLLEERQVIVRVRDYGSGIPPLDQQRLFDRFVRLERDINSSVRGAGLGLYICKQLIEAMGGRIWVESSGLPGRGSTFTFTLPAPQTQQKPFKTIITSHLERV